MSLLPGSISVILNPKKIAVDPNREVPRVSAFEEASRKEKALVEIRGLRKA